MIASTDLEKAMFSIHIFQEYLQMGNTNIPSVDPIDNVQQLMEIVVTEDDVLSKLLNLKKSPQDKMVITLICQWKWHMQ